MIEALDGIPITPYILDQFGFVALSVGSRDTSYHIEESDNDFIVVHDVLADRFICCGRHIKYVHELQNLYSDSTKNVLK